MKALEKLMDPTIIWVLIPVIAIIAVYSFKGLTRYYQHKERIEKIRAGIDPDAEEK
jgi:hypothetical protein